MCKDWRDYPEARDAFWADTTTPAALGVVDRELWHGFAAAAERAELDALMSANRGHFPAQVVTAR